MKIRVGIVDTDTSFVDRFRHVMKVKYGDIEFFVFPELNRAKTAADNSLLDLLLIDRTVFINQSVRSIPTSCKTAVLVNNRREAAGLSVPTVLRYMSPEGWHKTLCGLAGAEEKEGSVTGGVYKKSSLPYGAVYLFLSVCDSGAAAAASAFCRFLKKNCGYKNVAIFGPRCESGEDLWRMTETIAKKCEALALFIDLEDLNRIVIPVINSGAVVFVTDGMRATNGYIAKTIHRLPEITGESKEFIYAKTGIMYFGFDAEKGELFEDGFLTALGGFDNEKNEKAAFEKLVIMCTRK